MIILVETKSFLFAQKITVFGDDKSIIDTRKSSMNDLPENICALANMYNCKNIKISGSKKYIAKVVEKTNAIFNTKFAKADEFKLNIDII